MGKILAVSLVLFSVVFTPGCSGSGIFADTKRSRPISSTTCWRRSRSTPIRCWRRSSSPRRSRTRSTMRPASCAPIPTRSDVDGQWWDVSVKAVAHYPTVVAMMARQAGLDDRTGTGIRLSVHRRHGLDPAAARPGARAGNLYTTSELQVVDSGGEIELWPAQPQYLYVPQYDPAVVFFCPGAAVLWRPLRHRGVAQLRLRLGPASRLLSRLGWEQRLDRAEPPVHPPQHRLREQHLPEHRDQPAGRSDAR